MRHIWLLVVVAALSFGVGVSPAGAQSTDAQLKSQIEKKIADNRAEWVKHAKDLQATAVKAMVAAQKHDKDALLDVGEAIDNACESCHVVYWYPDQQKVAK